MKIINWLKEEFRKDSFLLPSTLIFISTFVMIGFSSDSLRYFVLDVIEITAMSFLATFVLYILVMPNLKKEDTFPISLFWAVIALMLTLGKF